MLFSISDKNINSFNGDITLIFVVNGNFEHVNVQDKELLEKISFKAEQDEVFHLVEKQRLYVGVSSLDTGLLRSASAAAIRSIFGKSAYKHLSMAPCENLDEHSIQAICEGILLGNYCFTRYKSKPIISNLEKVTIYLKDCSNPAEKEAIQNAINNADIIANATNFSRDIVNTTPDDCYPEILAQIANELCKNSALECNILKIKELEQQKMNAILAVARASRHDPCVIHLMHKPTNPKYVVTLVGKGLTYDSGGLSLKPSASMVNMKSDKSGAAAVLGIMKAIGELDLPIEVHGFIGAVENMIGGDAYKPDDVLYAKNGKTIEVRNTDAEGRLVLADVLSYAQQEVNADYIYDFATLTGACIVALGAYTIGIMGNSDAPKTLLKNASIPSGEIVTELHFNRFLKKLIKSEIADISNVSSSPYGGAITAGLFLSEFIEEENKDKWTHLDIAGPAFVEHTWGENPHGGSGAGVRLMVNLLQNLAK
ncbi:MAG: leucyl aminopeptidase [Sulfurovaceae bacterium]|nr:leucyl aminopeptidase [Sulfurovaceae bacterium]